MAVLVIRRAALLCCLWLVCCGCNRKQPNVTNDAFGPILVTQCDDSLWVVIQCESWSQRSNPIASPSRVRTRQAHLGIKYELPSQWSTTLAQTDVSLSPHMLTVGCVAGELVANDGSGATLVWTTDGFIEDEDSAHLRLAPDTTQAIQSIAGLPIMASLENDKIAIRQNADESCVEVVLNGRVEMSVYADGTISKRLD